MNSPGFPLSRQNASLKALVASLFTVLGLGAYGVSAQSIAGFNSNAPVNYEADRIELQDKQKRVILSGNVDIIQGDLRLKAARTTVAYIDNGGVKIQRIDATGGVTVTRGNETARGNVAIYDFNRRLITMVGNVALRRGSDTLKVADWSSISPVACPALTDAARARRLPLARGPYSPVGA